MQFDPTTGATLDTQTITLAGETVIGGTALTADPAAGTLWGILRLDGAGSSRELVTIDPSTGVATSIGNTGDAFASLAFDDMGRLFGVTGDGATTPESLFTLSQTDATATLFTMLGNGDDGEAIAFNVDDGLMYHASGRFELNDPVEGRIFETIDLDTLAITAVMLTTSDEEEISGLVYDGSGTFLAVNIDAQLSTLGTDGVQTDIAALEAAVDNFPRYRSHPGKPRLTARRWVGLGEGRTYHLPFSWADIGHGLSDGRAARRACRTRARRAGGSNQRLPELPCPRPVDVVASLRRQPW